MTTSVATLKLHNLLRGGRKYVYKKGQVVQSSDGRLSLALIDSGYVKRYQIINDGSIGVHGVYGPGNFFPLTLAFELLFEHSPSSQGLYSGPETFYYETMTDAIIYNIDNQTFVEKVTEDPTLYRGLLAEAGKRLHFYINRAENVTLKNSQRRVAHQLAFYAREFGEHQTSGHVKILVPLTHQTLADILSLTRETVSQSVGFLREKKLISTGKYVTVPNVKKLDEFARA